MRPRTGEHDIAHEIQCPVCKAPKYLPCTKRYRDRSSVRRAPHPERILKARRQA